MVHGATCQHTFWLAKATYPAWRMLAQLVLENSHDECDRAPDSYLQKISTAKGISFSVTYATYVSSC